MKKRIICLCMSLVMIFGLVTISETDSNALSANDLSQSINNTYPITPTQVTEIIGNYRNSLDKYMKDHDIDYIYWNAHYHSWDVDKLCGQVDNGDFLSCLTTSPCTGSRTKDHNTDKTCQSNYFPGISGKNDPTNARQCQGFADYIIYVIFRTRDPNDFTKISNPGNDYIKNLKPGDLIRYYESNGEHSAVVYKNNGTDISFIECNYNGGLFSANENRANCIIRANRSVAITSLQGKTRYIMIPNSNLRIDCAHKNQVGGYCKDCNTLDSTGYPTNDMEKGSYKTIKPTNMKARPYSQQDTVECKTIIPIPVGSNINVSEVVVNWYGHIWGRAVYIDSSQKKYEGFVFLGDTEKIKNQKPSSPTNLRAVTKSSKDYTATISWDAVPEAEYYEVQYCTSANSSWKTDPDYEDNKKTSYVSTGLRDRDWYKYHVYAVNGAGKSEPAEVVYKRDHTHSYSASVVQPTCIAQGYTVHVCSCGDRYTDTYKAALGHDYNTSVSELNYNSEGYIIYICNRCGDIHSHEPVGSNQYTVIQNDDKFIAKCKTCGELYDDMLKFDTSDAGMYRIKNSGTYIMKSPYDSEQNRAFLCPNEVTILGSTINAWGNKWYYTESGFLFSDWIEKIDTFGYCGGDTNAEYDEASGYYKNLTWELDDNGLLTISGSGKMADFSTNISPWRKDNPINSSIKSVVINKSVTSIGERAFCSCTGLTNITLPGSVTSIGNYAFSDCLNLSNITLPDSVTSIGDCAFLDCFNLSNITLPDSVTSIGVGAFAACISLISIDIPDAVTSIGTGTFIGCMSLTNITLSDSVMSIGEHVFGKLTNFRDHSLVLDYETMVTYLKELVAEDVYEKIPVSLDDWACTSLESIAIPDSVVSIGDYAFEDCINLTDVYYTGTEEEWNLISIGNEVGLENATIHYESVPDVPTSGYCGGDTDAEFDVASGCYKNLTWNLDSMGLLTISGSGKMADFKGKAPFARPWDVDAVKIVKIKNGVTSISESAFYGRSGLTNIIIPDSVTSIGDYAFSYCSSLANITIPDSVTSIGDYAFCYCSSLANIIIPDSVTSIGDSAFRICYNVTTIVIPVEVTSIGDNAFYGLHYVPDIYYSGTKEQWESINIGDNSNLDLALEHKKIHFNAYSLNTEGPVHIASIPMAGDNQNIFEALKDNPTEITELDLSIDTQTQYESVYVMIGLYDENGCFVGNSFVEAELEVGTNKVNIPVEGIPDNATKLKIFLLSGGEAIPLAKDCMFMLK